MTIADLKRQYYATHPDGLWFKNGGRKYGKFFPTRTVYGGKYFIEGDNTQGYTTYMVWRVVTEPRLRFEPVKSFYFLALALKCAKGEK